MFYKAKNNTLYREVVNQICQFILEGQVKKGSQLPSESKLCEQFGVSRTSVRAALGILQQMGVIETVRGKGSFVISDDVPYLNENLENRVIQFVNNFNHATQARQLLEPQIAFLAAQIATRDDIEDLQMIVDRCNEKQRDGTVTTNDLRMFHKRVVQITQNPVLISFVDTLIAMCDAAPETRLSVPNPDTETAAAISATHEQILNAIRERNPEDAYFYMRENLKDFYHNSTSGG